MIHGKSEIPYSATAHLGNERGKSVCWLAAWIKNSPSENCCLRGDMRPMESQPTGWNVSSAERSVSEIRPSGWKAGKMAGVGEQDRVERGEWGWGGSAMVLQITQTFLCFKKVFLSFRITCGTLVSGGRYQISVFVWMSNFTTLFLTSHFSRVLLLAVTLSTVTWGSR